MPTREEPMLAGVLLSVTAAITGILIATRRRWPGALAAWIAYLILLGPMSGIVPFGRLRGAVDRYTYLACLGWALVAGGAVAVGWRSRRDGRASRFRLDLVAAGALVAVLLAWSVLSWRQAAVWRDGVTLWTRAVTVVSGSPVARSNLGTALAARRDFAGAVVQYREAAREWSTHPGAFLNLGRALASDGRFAEAVGPFRRLVELRPGWAEGHRPRPFSQPRRWTGGLLTRAVELDPKSARAHESRDRALRLTGKPRQPALPARRPLGSTAPGHDLAVPGRALPAVWDTTRAPPGRRQSP
jgi:hypothetical protein